MHSTSATATKQHETPPPAAEPARRTRRIPDWLTLTVTGLVLLAFGVWMISPRFDIPGPSFVDDWSNIDNAPVALDELVRLSYEPAEAHDTRRYRPGYTAVWNSLQWRTLGAPDSMTGPNFWGVVRLALLIAALMAIVAFGLAGEGKRRHPALLAGWTALPVLMVLVTPGFAQDLARLGPVEPILLAGMGVGLAVVVAATRRLLESGRARIPWVLAFAAGYCLWLVGVYHKEASICALALFPFLYFFLDRRWRADGVVSRPLYRSKGFLAAAALLTLPLLHMLYQIRQVTEGGVTVYGNEVPSGIGGWATRLWDSAEMQWAFSGQLGTFVWLGVAAAVPFLLIGWALGQRRVPWLALGLVAAGFAAYLFQGLGGVATTRYYIPFLGLLAAAAAILLADGPRWAQIAAVTMVALFVWNNVDKANDNVKAWADQQKVGLAAVADVARLDPARCPVYMATFHAEDADAYPELIALQRDVDRRPCDRRFEGLLIQGIHNLPAVTNEAILETCAGKGLEVLKVTPVLRFFGCRKFKAQAVANQPPEDVLRWNRLVPGQRFSERIHSFTDRQLCKAEECRQQLAGLRASYR